MNMMRQKMAETEERQCGRLADRTETAAMWVSSC